MTNYIGWNGLSEDGSDGDRTDGECQEDYQGLYGSGPDSDKDCFGNCFGDGSIDNCYNCTLGAADAWQTCDGECITIDENNQGYTCSFYECPANQDFYPGCPNLCGYDTCGVCKGTNNTANCLGTDDCLNSMIVGQAGMDCNGNCIPWETLSSGTGFHLMDECGVCLDVESTQRNQSCTGCTDESSCNYAGDDYIFDDGSCVSTSITNELGFEEWSWVQYGLSYPDGTDCNGVCGGWNILDQCGNCYCELNAHPVYGSAQSMVVMSGDTNLDGKVGLEDIYLLLNYKLGNQYFNREQIASVDKDKDGICSLYDMKKIIKSTLNIGEKSSKLSKIELELIGHLYSVLEGYNEESDKVTIDSYTSYEFEKILKSIEHIVYKRRKEYKLNYLTLADYAKVKNETSSSRDDDEEQDGQENIDINVYCGEGTPPEPTPIDDCGVCNGDNSTCTGCTDMNADNYNSYALFPCSDSDEYWLDVCSENELSGENCCCVFTSQQLPIILSGNPELLDIYNQILEGNQSCIQLLQDINLPQSGHSYEYICNVILNMAQGNYLSCSYDSTPGDILNSCEAICIEFCSPNGWLGATCSTLNECQCECSSMPEGTGEG